MHCTAASHLGPCVREKNPLRTALHVLEKGKKINPFSHDNGVSIQLLVSLLIGFGKKKPVTKQQANRFYAYICHLIDARRMHGVEPGYCFAFCVVLQCGL